VGTPIERKVRATAVNSSLARARGESGAVLALYLFACALSSLNRGLISEGTPGEMDLKRGALLVGTEVVKDFGGGAGIALCCSTDSARFTQKWMVVLGRGGFKEEPRICKDQPASQRARSLASASGRGNAAMKVTSS
jgi:hypothetical protein